MRPPTLVEPEGRAHHVVQARGTAPQAKDKKSGVPRGGSPLVPPILRLPTPRSLRHVLNWPAHPSNRVEHPVPFVQLCCARPPRAPRAKDKNISTHRGSTHRDRSAASQMGPLSIEPCRAPGSLSATLLSVPCELPLAISHTHITYRGRHVVVGGGRWLQVVVGVGRWGWSVVLWGGMRWWAVVIYWWYVAVGGGGDGRWW